MMRVTKMLEGAVIIYGLLPGMSPFVTLPRRRLGLLHYALDASSKARISNGCEVRQEDAELGGLGTK
jgi:hypothetical protein